MVQQTTRPLYFCNKPLMIGSVDVACHAFVTDEEDVSIVISLVVSLMLEEAIVGD